MGYEGFDSNDDWLTVCSTSIGNQTRFDMSTPDQIDNAQRAAPEWYRNIDNSFYLYPQQSPITQVIVLRAPNPWGDKFGTIAAIMFGYQTAEGLDFAVCGNALYAQFYLNPARAPAPPTPVTLKATFTSSLSEDGKLTALGSLDGLCSTRGGGFLGGDPWRSSKYFIKALTKPCFVPWGECCSAPCVPVETALGEMNDQLQPGSLYSQQVQDLCAFHQQTALLG